MRTTSSQQWPSRTKARPRLERPSRPCKRNKHLVLSCHATSSLEKVGSALNTASCSAVLHLSLAKSRSFLSKLSKLTESTLVAAESRLRLRQVGPVCVPSRSELYQVSTSSGFAALCFQISSSSVREALSIEQLACHRASCGALAGQQPWLSLP